MLINHNTYLLLYGHPGQLCFYISPARNGEGCGSFDRDQGKLRV